MDYQAFQVDGKIYLVNAAGKIQTNEKAYKVDDQYTYRVDSGTVYSADSSGNKGKKLEKGEKLPIAVDGAYMNFSGVETKASRMAESEKCDKSALALGVLENVRDTLVKTINKAMTDTNTHRVLIVGGVASNGIIRNGLTKKLDGDVYFAKAEYSTDNAVGTAYLAHLAHKEA